MKKSKEDEIQFVLKRVGLDKVQKHRVKDFSKGMRQRLNLAQSLLGDNGLLILDEPTNGLDPYWIAKLKEIMLEEKAKGVTIIFSTHMLAFAEQIADYILVIDEGVVLASNEKQTLLESYEVSTLEQYWLKQIVENRLNLIE